MTQICTTATVQSDQMATPVSDSVCDSVYEKTLAVITAVRSRIEDGVVIISWDVSLEIDTVGYHLERWADGAWARVNTELIPAPTLTPTAMV